MGVERAAARAPARREARTCAPVAVTSAAVARWVSRIHASITQPVNSHTSPPVGTSGGPRRTRQAGQTGASRHQAQPLGDREQRRAGEQQPVVARARRQPGAQPPWRRAAVVGEGRAGPLHQVAERHPAGAGRLAAAALHARLHEAHEVVVGVGATPLDGTHRVDATARRQGLLPGDPERRAVRQAQPAGDARGQLGVVEPEVERRHDGHASAGMSHVGAASAAMMGHRNHHTNGRT